MFKNITNEEGKTKLNCDVQIFNEQVVKKVGCRQIKKCHVGRPRKVVGCNFFLFITSYRSRE
jgi:hypothetical protein